MIPPHARAIVEADAQGYAARIASYRHAQLMHEPAMWGRMKYHCAQRVWALRNAPCPGQRNIDGTAMLWRRRFEVMFGEELGDYVQRLGAALAVSSKQPSMAREGAA